MLRVDVQDEFITKSSAEENSENKRFVVILKSDTSSSMDTIETQGEKKEEERNKRALVDIVAVIDRSGSMCGEKFDAIVRTLNFLISQLTPDDRFSLVTYNSRAKLEYRLSYMTDEKKTSILTCLQHVTCDGATNISDAILLALLQFSGDNDDYRLGNKNDNETNSSRIRSILLFTDGQANEGITDDTQLEKVVRARLEQLSQKSKDQPQEDNNKTKPTVYTFGYGSDHCESILSRIASAGSGAYSYIEDSDNIERCFVQCLGGLLSIVAQQVHLLIKVERVSPMDKEEDMQVPQYHTFSAECKDTIIMGPSKVDFVAGSSNSILDISFDDLYKDEERSFIMDLSSIELKKNEYLACTAVLEYVNVLSGKAERKEEAFLLCLPEKHLKDAQQRKCTRHSTFIRTLARIEVAKALQDARDRVGTENFEAAEDIISKQVQRIDSYKQEVREQYALQIYDVTTHKELIDFLDMLGRDLELCKDRLHNMHVYESSSIVNYLGSMSATHYTQRSTTFSSPLVVGNSIGSGDGQQDPFSSPSSATYYSTPSQRTMHNTYVASVGRKHRNKHRSVYGSSVERDPEFFDADKLLIEENTQSVNTDMEQDVEGTAQHEIVPRRMDFTSIVTEKDHNVNSPAIVTIRANKRRKK